MINIGENIRKVREIKNMTREQMASKLKLSVSGYSKIERNEVDLTLSRIQEIARVLDCDLSQLLNFDPSQVFNVHGNEISVQNLAPKAENMHFHSDDYKEKYIGTMEAENERLKRLLKKHKIDFI